MEKMRDCSGDAIGAVYLSAAQTIVSFSDADRHHDVEVLSWCKACRDYPVPLKPSVLCCPVHPRVNRVARKRTRRDCHTMRNKFNSERLPRPHGGTEAVCRRYNHLERGCCRVCGSSKDCRTRATERRDVHIKQITTRLFWFCVRRWWCKRNLLGHFRHVVHRLLLHWWRLRVPQRLCHRRLCRCGCCKH